MPVFSEVFSEILPMLLYGYLAGSAMLVGWRSTARKFIDLIDKPDYNFSS